MRKRPARAESCWVALLLCALAWAVLGTQPALAEDLPDGKGLTNTVLALERLPVTVRVLFTMAHNDDEGYTDAFLPYACYVLHARCGLYVLVRGEVGHNLIGTEWKQPLAVMRVGEMLAASRYYGVQDLYYGQFAEFRVQTLEQALETWGRENVIRDLVEVIRAFRPHILVSLWSGTARDGHGHHQTIGLLTPEAAEAAGYPDRYPELTRKGLRPWRVRKVYQWAPPPRSPEPEVRWQAPRSDRGEAGRLAPQEGATLTLNGERYQPTVGRSLAELALQGFHMHVSQGKALYPMGFPGNESYRLKLASGPTPAQDREESLFDGIQSGLEGWLELVGDERSRMPFLAGEVERLQGHIRAALEKFDYRAPDAIASHILQGLSVIQGLISKVEGADLSETPQADLLFFLREKEKDFVAALEKVLGLTYELQGEFKNVVPGADFDLAVYLRNGSSQRLSVSDLTLRVPAGWEIVEQPTWPIELAPWQPLAARYRVRVAHQAPFTQSYWRYELPWQVQTEHRKWIHLPYSPPEVVGELHLRVGEVSFTLATPWRYRDLDLVHGIKMVDVQVTPAVSVRVDPPWTILTANAPQEQIRTFTVKLLRNSRETIRGQVRLELPPGWRAEPEEAAFVLSDRGQETAIPVKVTIPPRLKVESYSVRAIAEADGQTWSEGYDVVTHPYDWVRHVYRPAAYEAKALDLKLSRGLRVGYLSVSLDVRTEMPQLIQRFARVWNELGLEVEHLDDQALYYRDLSEFDCIIVGFYAYSRSEAITAARGKLLEFARKGGLLIATSQAPQQWNEKPSEFGPYPSKLAGTRIPYTAPVKLLQPEHPVLSQPNRITEADFRGWDEDLGFTVMDVSASDGHYQDLVAAQNRDGSWTNGGLTVADYGRGKFVYAGLYVVRQTFVDAIPGPYRILANIFSLAARR